MKNEYIAAADNAEAQATELERKGGPRRLQRAKKLREHAWLWRWQAEQQEEKK